jgi:hypothetical protein
VGTAVTEINVAVALLYAFFAAPNIVVHVAAVPQHPAIDMITTFLFQHHSTLLLHQLTSVVELLSSVWFNF